MIDQSLLLLLPEEWDAAADLKHAEKFIVVSDDELRLDEVGDVGIVVDASHHEAGAGPELTAAGYQHDLDWLALKV